MNTWWRHWSREHWNVATVYTVLTSTPTPAAVLQNFRTTPAPANCSVCWLQQGGSDGLCSRLLLRLSELQSGRHGISSSRVTSTEYRVQSAECGAAHNIMQSEGAAAPVSGCVGDSAGVLLVHCSAAATPHIASCSDQHPAAQQYIVTNIRLVFISLLKERCVPCAYTHDI